MIAFSILSFFLSLKGIIASVSAAVAGVVWLRVRHAKQQDDPETQYEAAKKENARIITNGDADALARALDADLNRLPNRPAAAPGTAGKPNP